jgi:hypothetical protein
MKLKKLKKLTEAIAALCRKPKGSIEGIQPTQLELAPGYPMLLLPTKGKYMLPEIQTINKIVTSIEPAELEKECEKINIQAGLMLLSSHPLTQTSRLLVVHVPPHGCCVYNVYVNLEDNRGPKISVDVDEELMDQLEIL